MIDAEQAKALVLHYAGASVHGSERFAVQYCALSERGDYWVVSANSEDFVVRGVLERFYIGISVYLVNTVSGQIETIGSSQNIDHYLEDKYDAAQAGDMHYVLVPEFGSGDKQAVMHLRRRLECPLQLALKLVSSESSNWLTGKRRTLRHAQAMLLREGIVTSIQLRQSPTSAELIDDSSLLNWDGLKSALNRVAAK
ncbi:hypothetical protein [Herbaspirillum rubrisubalbicans]|uniref:hypothetical protein n=1 Tax=Herbaspirillum rubrisubalbicans TaxID=80842 RepID=UPI0015C55617|nr:hypothetical protein [Herbaspirillum rubrisubalbicans]